MYVQSSITSSHCDSLKDLIMSVYNNTYLYIHPSGPRRWAYVICKCEQLIIFFEVQFNDIKVQCANVTGSIKFHNTEPLCRNCLCSPNAVAFSSISYHTYFPSSLFSLYYSRSGFDCDILFDYELRFFFLHNSQSKES